MAAGAYGDKTLQDTPTWAVAAVCAVFVVISVLIEHAIHSLGKWFQKRQKKAMSEALEKIKAELMLLGFISLLLTVGTRTILKICIPAKYADAMLPCKNDYEEDNYKDKNVGKGGGEYDHEGDSKRKLLSFAGNVAMPRVLAAAGGGDDYCSKDKVSLISQTGVHQLHIFLFVLAIFHVLYSVITMALGQAKMKKWKAWELETSSLEYQFTNDPTRFRLARQTSFVKRHSGISTAPGIKWIVAFFRQFTGSVTKVDYLTIRHGFINAHLAPSSKFDFHKYIKRCMEDDFKVVVEWYTFTWLTVVPLVILLLVGTKLELVIMEMAREMQDRSHVIRGAPVMGSHMKKAIFEEQTAKALRKWQKAAKLRHKTRKTGGEGGSSQGFMSNDSTPSRNSSPIHLLHNYRPSPPDVESVMSSAMSQPSDTDLSEFDGSAHDGHESRKQDHHQENIEANSADFSFARL
ncbi:unnamed protein product [Dovyalis caffra]|uniref:MLO-like protein n=1 Tax=Dovyalis caffra TaxID=77055 RepID=A0AAV1S7A0_9ROSI|nr:unnamed protein product [Dovyalis caffra]